MTAGTSVSNVPVSLIKAGDNDRKVFNPIELHNLAESIKANGLAQPITVRPMDNGAWFQIVAGERRFRAISTILNWDTVPAIVRELTDTDAAAIMLVENTARVDLDPISEANALRARIDNYGLTVKEVAAQAGLNVERVNKRLALLTLSSDIQHYIKIGQFPIGHALMIADLDKDRQRIALRAFNSAPAMSLAKFEEVVKPLRASMIEESQTDMFADLELLVQSEVERVTAVDAPKPLTVKRAQAEIERLTDLTAKLSSGVSVDIDAMIMALHALKDAGATRVTVALSESGDVDITGNTDDPLTMTVTPDTDTADNLPEQNFDELITDTLNFAQRAIVSKRFRIGLYDTLTDAPHRKFDRATARWTPATVTSITVDPSLTPTARVN